MQKRRHVILARQQKTPRIKGVRGFFICQKGQLAQIRRKKVVGIGITAHFCHIHKARVCHHHWRHGKGLRGHEHPVVPILIRKKIMKGQPRGGNARQVLFQPCVNGAAARAGTRVARQQQTRRCNAQLPAGKNGCGGKCRSAALHGHGLTIRQVEQAASDSAFALKASRAEGKIRVGQGSCYAPHATCLRSSSKAFCRL